MQNFVYIKYLQNLNFYHLFCLIYHICRNNIIISFPQEISNTLPKAQVSGLFENSYINISYININISISRPS